MTIKNHEFMFDAISKVRQVTEQRNAIKEALLSERGFTDERQLSLEKRRLLETKVDEVIARRGGNGGRQSGVISEAKQKMADKDYDKDGKIETSKDEVMGSRMRAAKKAGKMKGDDKTPPFTPDKKPVVRGTGGPGASAKWLAQQAKRRMMAKEEVEQIDEISQDLALRAHAKANDVTSRRWNDKFASADLADKGSQGMFYHSSSGEDAADQTAKRLRKHIKRKFGPEAAARAKRSEFGVVAPEHTTPKKKSFLSRLGLTKEGVEQMDEGAFKQREIKKQDAERERLRGTWEGGKQPYTPPKGDPRVDKTALRAREYYKKHGKMPPDLA